jgi:recombination protein RecA
MAAAKEAEKPSRLGMIAKINNTVQAEVEKKLGKDTEAIVFIAAGNEKLLDFGVIPFGNPAIDKAIGGGAPRGIPIQISGQEGTGKTMLCFDLIAYNQRLDPDFVAMYIHLEAKAFPLQSALLAGVDLSRLVVVSVLESAEMTFGIASRYLWDKKRRRPIEYEGRALIDVVVIDSVAGAASEAEITGIAKNWDTGVLQSPEKSAGQPGRLAALMSNFFRSVCGTGMLGKTALILINQLRVAVGEYNAPKKAMGGEACKFYPKIHIEVRKAGAAAMVYEDNDKKKPIIGHIVSFKVPKNNTGRAYPHVEGSYKVIYGKGVDTLGPLLDLGIEYGALLETSSGRFLIPELLENVGEVIPPTLDVKGKPLSGRVVAATTEGTEKTTGRENLERIFQAEAWFQEYVQNFVAAHMTQSAASAAPAEGADLDELGDVPEPEE